VETSESLADDAQVQIGISHYNRGNYDKAESALRSALERFPDTELLAQIRYWLGMSQIARRQWSEAAATFQEAVASHPEHALTAAMMFWLAEAGRHSGDLVLAKTYYERVVALWPDSDRVDDSLHAQIQLALTAADHDGLDALVQMFDERYTESPLRPAVKQAEGRSLLKRKEYARAVRLFEGLVQVTDKPEPDREQEEPAPIVAPETVQSERVNWYYLALGYLGNERHSRGFAPRITRRS
jgi:tetratricopeptide (TPR) repeat protein